MKIQTLGNLAAHMPRDGKSNYMVTVHAHVRSQQRGIPAVVDQALEQYGAKTYDGHGAIIVSFNRRCFSRMRKEHGASFARKLDKWKNAYKVKSIDDGATITIGHRTKRIRTK